MESVSLCFYTVAHVRLATDTGGSVYKHRDTDSMALE